MENKNPLGTSASFLSLNWLFKPEGAQPCEQKETQAVRKMLTFVHVGNVAKLYNRWEICLQKKRMEGWLWWWCGGRWKTFVLTYFPIISLFKSNKLHDLKKMVWGLRINKMKHIFLFLSRSYISSHTHLPLFFSPSSYWFTMLIKTLFMPWAFSPTLSNDRFAIFMPISFTFPRSSSRVTATRELFLTINAGVDLLPFNNWSYCQRKRKCLLCAESIYLRI